MVKIYGQELRQVALRALERGKTRREVSALLCVSIPTLDRWRHQYRHHQQDAPRARGHNPCAFSAPDLDTLKQLVQEHPDATLDQHVALWNAHTGRTTSRSSVNRALDRLNWSYKKRVFEPPNAMKRNA